MRRAIFLLVVLLMLLLPASLWAQPSGAQRIRAGTGITISPASGVGVVTISASVLVGPVALNVGSAALPAYSYVGNTNAGAYLVSSGILGWSTAGVERMRLNSTGLHVPLGVSVGTNPALTGAIRLPASGLITSRNATNTADIDLFSFESDDNIHLHRSILPNVHNAYDLGQVSSPNWRALYLGTSLNVGSVIVGSATADTNFSITKSGAYTADQYGADISITNTSSGASFAGRVSGLRARAYSSAPNILPDHPSLVAIQGQALYSGIGRLDYGIGVDAYMINSNAVGTVGDAYVLKSQYLNQGITNNAYGLHVDVINFGATATIGTTATAMYGIVRNLTAGGVITAAYGLRLDGWSNVGTVTTSYGIYLGSSIDMGATKYAIYSLSTSPSLLTGSLTTSTLTTGALTSAVLTATGLISPDLQLVSANDVINIRMGDNNTDATNKESRVGAIHYTLAEEPISLIGSATTSAVALTLIGGGFANMNAATSIDFYTAANTTTLTGTNRLSINSNAATLSVPIWGAAGTALVLGGGGVSHWQIQVDGTLRPQATDNGIDIGLVSNRVRSLYVGTSVVVGTASVNNTIGSTQLISTQGTLAGASTPFVNHTATWNNAATAFIGFLSNTTNTASNAASKLFDWRVGGVSHLSLTVSGVTQATQILSTGPVEAGAATRLGLANRSSIYSPSDSILTFTNNAATNFARINFGGDSSAFPGLGRSGAGLYVLLADGSAGGNLGIGATPVSGVQLALFNGAAPAFALQNTASGVASFDGFQLQFDGNGYIWNYETSSIYFGTTGINRGRIDATGQWAIGPSAPDADAILDLQSTTLGFLLPKMTTAQRDAIATPTIGLMIFNTTTNKINVRGASAWEVVTSS